jgi:hypothetical protein
VLPSKWPITQVIDCCVGQNRSPPPKATAHSYATLATIYQTTWCHIHGCRLVWRGKAAISSGPGLL